MTHRQFRLPDLGEGLTDADIVRWLVQTGDAVTVNQPLVEVETAKAVVEIPSPFAGVLVERHVDEGTTLEVGAPLLTIHTADEDGSDAGTGADSSGGTQAGGQQAGPAASAAQPPSSGEGSDERTPVLVGYGPRAHQQRRRSPRRRTTTPGQPAQPAQAVTVPVPVPTSTDASAVRVSGPAEADPQVTPGGWPASAVLAKPPVRKLARDLGVDLTTLVGTGPGGTICRGDVEAAVRIAARAIPLAAPPVWPTGSPGPTYPAPAGPRPGGGALAGAIPADATYAGNDDADGAGVWRVPVVGVRRSMAQAMVASVAAAPHVTEFLSADATETIAARERIAALPEFAGIRITPLLFVARALLVAVRRHPMINSRWVEDEGAGRAEIQISDRVNLGIAVAGPRGLVVPHIPDAGRLDLVGLSRALAALTDDARADRLEPARLRGATITITNVGALGVDIGTPILNPPEAAILALGAIRPTPWVHEGQVTARTVVQLALSFDHRIVDGRLGAAVLADIGAMLTDPTVALAWS
ncbi:2-oxoisovalerate dehydrogenase E2 component (dihydrolipoyl transacylase) [Frankia sp. AiPs1]|uniref:dihydrolipoamide acetyltransferase family protein n=1 Tax=Frankia sp. AiPa1 TaxID=573492 RepID=UPI00202B798A|nr:dihydrolipoamide acetyltransferase family protein [Frankia sp. AiPa1]MCL9760759.1 2-oxo acid dehydrogenase subunit E2 [Frankia sp. AiPa1]